MAIGGLCYLAYRKEINRLKAQLVFPTNVTVVAVGDSRVETDYDSSVLKGVRNCGLSNTPLSLTAAKAKLIVEQNRQIKLVVLDVWPGWHFFDNDESFDYAPFGSPLLELHDWRNMPPIGDSFPERFVNGVLRPGIRHMLGFGSDEQNPLIGGFNGRSESLKTNKWSRIETYLSMRHCDLENTPVSQEQVLCELIEWLLQRKINVALVSSPLHHLWWENIYTPKARSYFEQSISNIAKQYGILWYNHLHDFQADDNWADGPHMNAKGARLFSHILDSEIKASVKFE